MMKPSTTPTRILTALGLLVIVGALAFTTVSCGKPKKHKVDDSTVLPFKDKAELDRFLDLPDLPEYTIEEYYTPTDLVAEDKRFVVCCKFLEVVSAADVQKIVNQVNNGRHPRWSTFNLGKENNMRLFFDLDTTLAAGQKRPDFLKDKVHVEVEMMCRKGDTWKGFEVVFRNDRADYSVAYDRDTLSKMLGVEFPPLTEEERIDETIFYEFDTVPGEDFYQALEKAPNWTVSHHGDRTLYVYDYDDGEVSITANLFKGETDFTFTRQKTLQYDLGKMMDRMLSSSNKKSE